MSLSLRLFLSLTIQPHLAGHIVNRLSLQATVTADVDFVRIIEVHHRFYQLPDYMISILNIEIPRAQSQRFVVLFRVVLGIIQEFFPVRAVGDIETHGDDDATIAFIQVVVEFCLKLFHQLSDIMLDIVALLVGLEIYLLKTPIKTLLPVRHMKEKIVWRHHQRLTLSRT